MNRAADAAAQVKWHGVPMKAPLMVTPGLDCVRATIGRDGQGFTDMPVLIKTKRKTTTDHISPAGLWPRFCGHLDRFSDNMVIGATNAFSSLADAGST
jgi:aconitase A